MGQQLNRRKKSEKEISSFVLSNLKNGAGGLHLTELRRANLDNEKGKTQNRTHLEFMATKSQRRVCQTQEGGWKKTKNGHAYRGRKRGKPRSKKKKMDEKERDSKGWRYLDYHGGARVVRKRALCIMTTGGGGVWGVWGGVGGSESEGGIMGGARHIGGVVGKREELQVWESWQPTKNVESKVAGRSRHGILGKC